jgi:hypothetical protein
VESLWDEWLLDRYDQAASEFVAWLGQKKRSEFDRWLRRER